MKKMCCMAYRNEKKKNYFCSEKCNILGFVVMWWIAGLNMRRPSKATDGREVSVGIPGS